jgi:hypothetical protein
MQRWEYCAVTGLDYDLRVRDSKPSLRQFTPKGLSVQKIREDGG